MSKTITNIPQLKIESEYIISIQIQTSTMKINPLLLLTLSAFCDGFDVSKAIRTSNKVEEYSPTDRAWRFPDQSKIRHSDGPSPNLQPEDRVWGQAKPNEILRKSGNSGTFLQPEDRKWRMNSSPNMVMTDTSTQNQIYTDSDRKSWTAPDSNKLRHSDALPTLGPEDRLWRLKP